MYQFDISKLQNIKQTKVKFCSETLSFQLYYTAWPSTAICEPIEATSGGLFIIKYLLQFSDDGDTFLLGADIQMEHF